MRIIIMQQSLAIITNTQGILTVKVFLKSNNKTLRKSINKKKLPFYVIYFC